MCLGIGDEIADGLVGAVDGHADKEVVAEQGHQDVEVLVQVVGQLLEQVGVGRDMDVVQLDHVRAVGRAALEFVDGDEAVAAGTVFHHHGLAPGAAQLVGHQARNAIGTAAYGEGVDDARGLGGPLVALGERGGCHGCGNGAECECSLATAHIELMGHFVSLEGCR